jgi:hypothetical protein
MLGRHSASTESATPLNAHDELAVERQKAERELALRVAELGIDAARQRCDERLASLRAAEQLLFQLQQEQTRLVQAHDRFMAATEPQLRAMADGRIRTFLTWIETQQAALPREIRRTEGFGPPDVRTGVRPTVGGSNLDAIQRVLEALSQARDRAEAMKLEFITDVGAALQALRESIPTVREAEDAIAREQADLAPAS